MPEHYLDNSATTSVLPKAAEAAVYAMTRQYGNASSLHSMGYQAKCLLEDAREIIAQSLCAEPNTIYFTSGGTESNNLAIFGAVNARRRKGNKIVTTMVEHPSVLASMEALAQQGYEVCYLKPDKAGHISPLQLAEAIDEETILVSMMLVNNETGAILPVAEAAKAIRRKHAPALLHVDAVQGYLKLPISPKRLCADLISVSGHKVHAPKGIGALYVSKAARILPRQLGGGQEGGLRSGTEAMPLISAFGTAVRLAAPISETTRIASELNRRLRAGLADPPPDLLQRGLLPWGSHDGGVAIHSAEDGLPHILNFSAGAVRAETMLHFLSQKGIYVSSGSACGKARPSHVLTAMDVDPALIATSLRVSFSKENTADDVDALLAALYEGIRQLKTGS